MRKFLYSVCCNSIVVFLPVEAENYEKAHRKARRAILLSKTKGLRILDSGFLHSGDESGNRKLYIFPVLVLSANGEQDG